MTEIRLRFPQHAQADLALDAGLHGLAWREGAVVAVEADGAPVELCVDRRGLWLKVAGEGCAVHVNGRRVRRLAMLRVGDAIHLDGVPVQVLGAGDVPRDIPEARGGEPRGADAAGRLVLRGVGGQHHGRCIALDRSRTVGGLADCDIRIDAPDFPDRHARLEPQGDTLVLRGLAQDGTSVVNGERVRDALLSPGDQVVFDAHHRFVVEAPGRPPPRATRTGPAEDTAGVPASSVQGQARRMPWLLLAAALLAAALAALLLFGTA